MESDTATDNTMNFTPRRNPVPCIVAASLSTALALWLAGAPVAAAETGSAATVSSAARRVYFTTPQDGFDALAAALRNADDRQVARLLGPGHAAIIDSGDAAADRAAAARFVAGYERTHVIQMDGDARAFVAIGADEWPMPVPMVRSDAGWTFDAKAGAQELLARRIGRNELDTIQTCRAFIDMQEEYAAVDRNGDGLLEYAARIVSTPGKHDGLYWATQEDEPQSPAGPLLAAAVQPPRGGAATPYHGYYYRILTAQGKHAPDGAMNYYANGKLIGGVALIAYPARYRGSGVKTFLCSMSELVYEKDLGADTPAKAARIKAYDPGRTWTKVD